MAFQLRPYQPSDFEALYEMDQACYPRGIAYSRRMLRWFLEQPGADSLIAEESGAPDGVIGFLVAEARGTEAHIITVDVAAAQRRAGVGSALLREMEARLVRRGVREVSLETATNNEAAVAFWRRHGYRFAGVLRRYYLGRLDAFLMQKGLETGPEKNHT